MLIWCVLGGQLRVLISRSFPMQEGGAAHRWLAARAAIGKVLLAL